MYGMSSNQHERDSEAQRKGEARSRWVDRIAARALSEVALRAKAMRDSPDEKNIAVLFDAAIGDDPLLCSVVARRMIADGVPPAYICDIYIPAVARRMGDDWCEDEMTFSNVTIGTSRMQYLLREIGPGKSDDLRWNANGDEASVLLLLSRDANHTLGVMVLAGQLRRMGFSVKLSLGESTAALLETMAGAQFDAVFVSACMTDDLEGLRSVVEAIKTNSAAPPPIILGGFVVEQGRDALQVTGVDKVTNKLEEALAFCKLNRSTNS